MIQFGTLGAARITPIALVYPCMNEPRASITAMAARDRTRAKHFADAHHIRHVCEHYQAVIEHPEVNAVYVPLPITAHREWTIAALDAGKPVLCEKSFASNAAEAQAMHDRAMETGLVLMDAFHYRYHPVFQRALEIVKSGVLGTGLHIKATFNVPATNPDDIRMNYGTGGGVTMDIGCYPVSWVRHLTGSEPVTVEAEAIVGPPDVDVALTSHMTFADGTTAETSGDMRAEAGFMAEIIVTGSDGTLTVKNPLAPQLGHLITLTLGDETQRETLDRRPTYCYQLDAFISAVEKGTPLPTDSTDAVKQMQTIDRIYEAAGLPLRGL